MVKLSPRNNTIKSVRIKSTFNRSQHSFRQVLRSTRHFRSTKNKLDKLDMYPPYKSRAYRILEICQGMSNSTARRRLDVKVPRGVYILPCGNINTDSKKSKTTQPVVRNLKQL